MPKRSKMFAGITRQVVISDETHRCLFEVAQEENKYIGELADELIREALLQRQARLQRSQEMDRRPRSSAALPGSHGGSEKRHWPPGTEISPPALAQRGTSETTGGSVPVERLALMTSRAYYKYHCLVCDRDWIGGGEEETPGVIEALPKRCNYQDCRAYRWNDPVAAAAAREKRQRRQGRAVS